MLREASLFMRWGGAPPGGRTSRGGGEKFWTRREGGAKNFGRVAKGGGEQFWTRREGGVENFGRIAKGEGRKILDLVNFFSKFLKHSFFMFCGYFGHFQFFGQRGGRKILDASRMRG